MNAEPLALIEYWAVDPDYDGQLFRSVWQDYRGNTAGGGDPLRVITQATLTVTIKVGSQTIWRVLKRQGNFSKAFWVAS